MTFRSHDMRWHANLIRNGVVVVTVKFSISHLKGRKLITVLSIPPPFSTSKLMVWRQLHTFWDSRISNVKYLEHISGVYGSNIFHWNMCEWCLCLAAFCHCIAWIMVMKYKEQCVLCSCPEEHILYVEWYSHNSIWHISHSSRFRSIQNEKLQKCDY